MKNPRQSPIFRFITEHNGGRDGWITSANWPEEYVKEATIFATTPGISYEWLSHNLGLSFPRIKRLRQDYPEWTTLGFDNVLTATYDDAVNYIQRGPKGTKMPDWVIPFYMADKKMNTPLTEMYARWGYRRTIHYGGVNFLKDQSHVLHSSHHERRRHDVDA